MLMIKERLLPSENTDKYKQNCNLCQKVTAIIMCATIVVCMGGYLLLVPKVLEKLDFIPKTSADSGMGTENGELPLSSINTMHKWDKLIELKEKAQNGFNEILFKYNFIEINGGINRIMNKEIIVDANRSSDIIRDKSNHLQYSTQKLSPDTLLKYANNLSMIYEYSTASNIPLLYIQAPSKVINDVTVLPDGINDYSNQNIDAFLEIINNYDIPNVDIRNRNNSFYKTDHHWDMETSFNAFCKIIEYINIMYDFNLDSGNELRNINNYDRITYENSFLGSMGIRVGKYYVGKDDFEILYPKFVTNMSYKHLRNNKVTLETEGTFDEALIDKNILNTNINNKYNAYSQGSFVETIIINNIADNNKKLLLIADSFGRPVIQYLSLCFAESRYLDPQAGRYTQNYINYIDEYEPDIIVILFNGNSLYIPIQLNDGD